MRMKAGKRFTFPIMMLLGVLAVAAAAALIWALEAAFDAAPLAGEDGVGNYLGLLGVSFSVTFLTTSLFGGLSDKSEKIYWLSYPESYLINIPLNFMVLSSLSFLCLGFQALAALLVRLPEYPREALFLASFVVGIAAIVLLSYKFTAVFFSRGKLVKKAEDRFGAMVEKAAADPAGAGELRDAVIGLFNNTLEAALAEGSDLDRVSENIRLLLRYPEEATCAFWLRKLVLEIGKVNTAMLVQLAARFDGAEDGGGFTPLLESALNRKDLPFNASEILSFLYELRFRRLRRLLEAEAHTAHSASLPTEYEDQLFWSGKGKELDLLLRRIDTSSCDNCCFVLENLSALPALLLRQDACIGSVTEAWGDAVAQYGACVRARDTRACQKLHSLLFPFLLRYPARSYDDSWGELVVLSDQLGEVLNKKAAECIDDLTRGHHEALSYMIDVIEDEEERAGFVLWVVDRMADGALPEELWDTGKYAGYRWGGTYEYAGYMTEQLLRRLHEKEKALDGEYARRKETDKDLYEDNIPLLEYLDELRRCAGVLARGKKYETGRAGSCLRTYVAEAISRVCPGEENSFPSLSRGDGPEAEETEVTVNVYALLFDVLRREKVGLEDLRDALAVRSFYVNKVDNYFDGRAERAQKRSELLFFLAKLSGAVRGAALPEDERRLCAELMARVLTNPCVGPVSKTAAENPEEVNACLAYLRADAFAADAAEHFLALALPADDPELCSEAEEIFVNASICEEEGEPEAAARLRRAGEAYEAALRALQECLR